MPNGLSTFLIKMNRFHWVRLTVCLLPGILVLKIGSASNLEAVQTTGSVLLFVGIVIYAAWNYLARTMTRKFEPEEFVADEPQVEQPTPAVRPAPKSPRVSMQDLVLLCGGNAQQAVDLVSIETELQEDLPYDDAISLAYKRKKLTDKNH